MSLDALTFRELLDYTREETGRWREWLSAQPDAVLATPIGEGSRATVRDLVVHVFAVEMRYAQRLLGEPVTPYEALRTDTLDDVFGIAEEARGKLVRYLEGATDDGLRRVLTFETLTAGTQTASARKIVAHALLHGARHWAQIATTLRQAGHPQPWPHDLLFSTALD